MSSIKNDFSQYWFFSHALTELATVGDIGEGGGGVVGLIVGSSCRRCASQCCCCGMQSSIEASARGAAENRTRVFPVEDYGQRAESPR